MRGLIPRAAVDGDLTVTRGGRRRVETLLHWPTTLYLILVTQAPFLYALWLSLHSWNLQMPGLGVPFVGLENYAYDLFQDSTFWISILNTFVITAGTVIVMLILGFVFALLLNRRLPGRGLLRTLLIIPFLVTSAVTAVLWKDTLLNPTYGMVNYLLSVVGIHGPPWLTNYGLVSIIAMNVWQWTPFCFLILLSGLQALPEEVMEGAQLDGAGRVALFRHIIVPQMVRYIEVAVLLGSIFVFQTFGKIYIGTGGGPGVATTNLSYYVYRVAFLDFSVGGAASLGVIGVVLAFVAVQLLFRVFREGTAL